MKKDSNKNKSLRRDFLKNITLTGLGLGVLSNKLKANPAKNNSLPNEEDCPVTTPDYYGTGPFYTANAPEIENNLLAENTAEGERIIISGRVLNLDCSEVIPNAAIDIWHADTTGAYDNSGFNMRGKTYTNEQGFYLFETIKPGHYLNGASFRPAHIHIKVTPPNYPTITTQLYFEGDPYIAADAAASITSGTYDASHRIIPLTANAEGKKEGTWDIIVDGEGVDIGTSNDLHLEQGMIYKLSPNPFSEQLVINYGVFRPAKVSLSVFDLQGKLVANLDEKQLDPQKYKAVWQAPANLVNGYYFITLKINDLQVHYQKVSFMRGAAYGY